MVKVSVENKVHKYLWIEGVVRTALTVPRTSN
jgi:hypothetical protein